MSDAVIEAREVSKEFPDGERTLRILAQVDLAVSHGESVAVMGASGSGKSTLLHCLGLLDKPTSGSIFFAGEDVTVAGERRRNALRCEGIGFVFQNYHLLPELTALENAALAARVAGKALGESMRKAEHLLCQLGLSERLAHRPSRLSGGEQQRVAIARALINQPQLLLCDEPTGNLDPVTGHGVLDALFDTARLHASALVIVTHDPSVAARAQKAYRIVNGCLAKDAQPKPVAG